jgi:CYTH domain-containing protein
MIRRLEQKGGAQTSGETADEWRTVSEVLKRRLSAFKTVMHLGRPSRHPAFRSVAGQLIQEHVDDLRSRLATVHGRDDAEEAHRARISAKRLRYLLEPLARKGRAVPGFVERLKGLQDLLGELRDVQVLAREITQSVEEVAAARARRLHGLALEGAAAPAGPDAVDEAPGLVALARVARSDADRLYGEVEAQWLSGRADAFLASVHGFAQSLARRKRGRTEIERKFLLSGLPERLRAAPANDVTQGWIPGAELHERVRRTRGAGGEVFTRTLKFGNGIRRTEIEEPTTREIFDSLWPLTAGRRVEKRRYEVPEGDLVWEVDQFVDRELVLAEVELPAEDTPVELPGWLRPYVVREVTEEPEFVNLNLAK